jgi:AcrR family transcriptional regulator
VDSHAVTRARVSLQPRKTPVQARSAHTVEAIFDATIQVLLAVGPEQLTTTRVAERAGVSVGTLYQYFPNKQALLSAVLQRHLLRVVAAVEQACLATKGQTVTTMAAAVVGAFVDAKVEEPAASRALYAVAAEVGGEEVVTRLTQRAQLALCELLATASDRHFDQLSTISFVLTTAIVGPVQGLLVAQSPPAAVALVRAHRGAMAAAYLRGAGTRRVT